MRCARPSSREESPLGRRTLEQLVRNYEVAATERVPVCQDSGVAVVFLEIGQDVHWVGGPLTDAVHAGIREGTQAGYLRKSVTGDPTRRVKMAGDFGPTDGHGGVSHRHRPRRWGAAHGRVKGLRRREHERDAHVGARRRRPGITNVVVDTVERAGANACPPVIVGVGIGGTFEAAALLAKKAAFRELTIRHPRPDLADLESALLERINALGIGPQGLGGRVTALAVNIEILPTHIAGLPVAVNLGCHSTRRMTVEL